MLRRVAFSMPAREREGARAREVSRPSAIVHVVFTSNSHQEGEYTESCHGARVKSEKFCTFRLLEYLRQWYSFSDLPKVDQARPVAVRWVGCSFRP